MTPHQAHEELHELLAALIDERLIGRNYNTNGNDLFWACYGVMAILPEDRDDG